MITYNPSGVINLVKVPLDKDYEHQLTFENLSSQTNYFNTQVLRRVYEDYTYIKKDNVIKVNDLIDDIEQYNYLYYYNSSTGKRFYCFIDKMEYIGNQCTAIYFSTDVIQTYLFDMDLSKHSLIEREHTTSDTIGGNRYPEGLEHGDYEGSQTPTLFPFTTSDFYWVIAVSDSLDNLSLSRPSSNIPDGLLYIGVPDNGSQLASFRNIIGAYTASEKINAIYSVFVAPKEHFGTVQHTSLSIGGHTYEFDYCVAVEKNISKTVTLTPPSQIAGYPPVNNKLKYGEYQFLQVSNNSGCCYNYNIEDFRNTSELTFTFKGSLGIGGSYYLYPNAYKNITDNYDEGIPLGKFPVGSFISDPYLNWLTQNSLNVFGITKLTPEARGYLASGIEATQGIANLVSGNSEGVLEVIGAGTKALETYNQMYHQKQIPDQVEGNTNCGDVAFSINRINYTFKFMCIKPYYATRLDKYFSMYGYKTNDSKSINLHTRTYWNYIKTSICNIESLSSSYIPQEYLSKIKSIFNKGITFWHNPTYFMDFTRTNSIIS